MAEAEKFHDPREDIKAALRAYAMEDGVYRIGTRAMNEGEWERSVVSADARKTLEKTRKTLAETRRNDYAKIDAGSFGGSGYAEFGKRLADATYESDLSRAVNALSASYSDYYDDLPRNQASGKLTRVNTLSYMISNSMTVEEGTLYALASGLSFEESIALARDAVRLQESIDYRLFTYNPQDQ